MVAGLLKGYDDNNGVSKAEHYALIQRLAAKNKEINGSIICRELLAGTVKLSSDDSVKSRRTFLRKNSEYKNEIA